MDFFSFSKDDLHIDICNDPAFNSSREAFKAVGTSLKKEGKGSIEHKPSIRDDDMRILHDTNSV